MIPNRKHKSLYHDVSREIADLVVSKQAAYGDSFGKSGSIMKILYPDGIKPEAMEDALTIVRIIDKLFRIATNKNAFGENPFKDILGYALLAVTKENIRKVQEYTFNYATPIQNWDALSKKFPDIVKPSKMITTLAEELDKFQKGWEYSKASKTLALARKEALGARSIKIRTKPLTIKKVAKNGKIRAHSTISTK